jgi:glycosyltransferase involved in cell wall biosynthesis
MHKQHTENNNDRLTRNILYLVPFYPAEQTHYAREIKDICDRFRDTIKVVAMRSSDKGIEGQEIDANIPLGYFPNIPSELSTDSIILHLDSLEITKTPEFIQAFCRFKNAKLERGDLDAFYYATLLSDSITKDFTTNKDSHISEDKVPIVLAGTFGFCSKIATYMNDIIGVPWAYRGHGGDIYNSSAKQRLQQTQSALLAMPESQAGKDFILEASKDFPNCNKSIFSIIYNGADTSKFFPLRNQKTNHTINLVNIARHIPKKDLYTLIEAISLLDNSIDIRLRQIGTGDLTESLKKKVEELGLTDKIIFEGLKNQDEIAKILGQSDCMVFTSCVLGEGSTDSRADGTPISILEAMEMKLPVIGANAGGIPEEIIDGETGYLFESKNPQDLAEKITAISINPEQRIKMGENAHRYVREKFDYCTNMGILAAEITTASSLSTLVAASNSVTSICEALKSPHTTISELQMINQMLIGCVSNHVIR